MGITMCAGMDISRAASERACEWFPMKKGSLAFCHIMYEFIVNT